MNVFQKLKERVDSTVKQYSPVEMNQKSFDDLSDKIGASPSRVAKSLGTLGGG